MPKLEITCNWSRNCRQIFLCGGWPGFCKNRKTSLVRFPVSRNAAPEGPSLCQRWLWCLCSLVTWRWFVSISPFLEPHTPHLAVRNALEASTASCIRVCISGAVLNGHLMRNKYNDGWAGDLLAPEPTWLVHQPSHKYWQPDWGAFNGAQHQYSKCVQNLIIFPVRILLWITSDSASENGQKSQRKLSTTR